MKARKPGRYAFVMASILVVGSTAVVGEEVAFPLVEEGRPVAKVLFAGEDKYLAASVEDLKTYVEKISGAKLEVSNGTADLPGPTLHLGGTDLFARTADAREDIVVDGFIMQKIGEDLILAGNLPQGTANGIYTVLQDQFGVRWYHPGELWEIVPPQTTLTIGYQSNAPGGARLENPAFRERSLWGGPPTQAFGRRMRMTRKGTPLGYVGAGHHLNRVVNPEKFGDKPEYFAYWDGQRHVEHDVHPCFTHPDMVDIFTEHVREGGSSFGVNDNTTVCRCERCLAVDGDSEPYMGMPNVSESYFQLIAKVAERAKTIRPGHRIGVFAYQITNAPPKTVDHIGDNIDVVLCQDTSQYFDPEVKRQDQRMSAEWVRKCGHVRFYGYVGINYWTPRYFPSILADQLEHLHRVGVVGFGTHSVSMPDSSMPMFYMMHQMLWDADLDADKLISQMIDDLYQEAADPIRAFYAHWEDCWERQEKGRWFWGMDNFRGEMEIYTRADIEKGKRLLEAAASLAADDTVARRVAWLRERYAYTYASAMAHESSMKAINWGPSESEVIAAALASDVAAAWRGWADALDHVQNLNPRPWGWLSKTFRVRAWGLKQQMRDASIAPLVRWVCANEARVEPARLREIEQNFAERGQAARRMIEERVTEPIGAAIRKPRVDALRTAHVQHVEAWQLDRHTDGSDGGLTPVTATEWHFRDRPENQEIGKYEEPMPQNYVDPPDPADQSVEWSCGWNEQKLFIRVVATDDRHEQGQAPSAMWKEDSVQIAFNPERDNFELDVSSWDYIWGGYHRQEAEFGISLRGDETQVHVWHTPPALSEKGVDPASLIEAVATRIDDHRVAYEAAVDWKLLPGFEPKPRRSFGICIVVNDTDHGKRRSAEYGSGICHAKRPTEFAAVRLVKE